MMAADHSERVILLNKQLLDKVSLDKVLEIYKARFANPADFTFIFVGNIHPENNETVALISKWLGGIKAKGKKEHFQDRGIRAPKGEQKNYFTRDMQIKTATNRIQYTSYDIPYTLANALNMEVIGRVLDMRYLESIREREGGSYGVGTAGFLRRVPVPCAILLMQFDTDPLKQERLMQIIHEEVQTIIKDGPREEDLQKAKESMLKDFSEELEKNDWWIDALEEYYRYGINLPADYAEAVKSVTAETVQNTLKKLIDSGNVFEVVMMPE
jgi:zinc protease